MRADRALWILMVSAAALPGIGLAQSSDPRPANALRATVTGVAGGAITIDAGSGRGVGPGDVFKVFAPARQIRIPLTNTVTYVESEVIAKIEITKAEPERSTARVTFLKDGATLRRGLDAVYEGRKSGAAAVAAAPDLRLVVNVDRVYAGRAITLTARLDHVDDAGRAGATFAWSADGGTLLQAATPVGLNQWHPPRAAGAFTVRCRCVLRGNETTLDAVVSVRGLGLSRNDAPTALPFEYAVGRNVYDGGGLRVSAIDFGPDGAAVLLDASRRFAYVLSPFGALTKLDTVGRGSLRTPVAAATFGGRRIILDRKLATALIYDARTRRYMGRFDAAANLDDAWDLAVSPRGMAYVLDRGRRAVVMFDSQGRYRLSFGRKGRGSGQFLAPVALAMSPRGDLWVLDAERHDIQGFDAFLGGVGTVLVTRTARARPTDLAIAPDAKSFYVLFTNPEAVGRFDFSGHVLSLSGKGKAGFRGIPRGAERIATDPLGRVYIAGRGLPHLLRYTADGKSDGRYGGEDFGEAVDVAADATSMYVADLTAPYVMRYGRGGWFLGRGVQLVKRGGFTDRALGRLVAGGVAPDGAAPRLFGVEYGSAGLYSFDNRWKLHNKFGGRGRGIGQFHTVGDVGRTKDGGLAVLDTGTYKVSFFAPGRAGPVERAISKGKRAHELATPTHMAVDPETNDVYIYNAWSYEVKKYSGQLGHEGNFGRKGSRAGQFLSVLRMVVDETGLLWVADVKRGDIQVLDLRAPPFRHLRTFKPKELNARMVGIATDPTGRLHVLTDRESVLVFRIVRP